MHLIGIVIQMLLYDLHHMNRVGGFDVTAGSIVYGILFAIIGVGEIARPFNASRPYHGIGIASFKYGRLRRKNRLNWYRHKTNGLINSKHQSKNCGQGCFDLLNHSKFPLAIY